jgi:hypothetical protein
MKVLVNDFVRAFRSLPSPERQHRAVLRVIGPPLPFYITPISEETTGETIAAKDIVLISEPQPDGGRAWVMDL